MRVRLFPVLLIPVVALLAGCATPPKDPAALAEFRRTNDPLEPLNRVSYALSDAIDVVLLHPLALGYNTFVPSPLRSGVHNVLTNLHTPVTLANDMMEGKPRRAGDSLMRLVINTTLGVGGLFDPATGLGYPAHSADFGLTLALWGVSSGPYLYLPLFGPSNPRDTVGMAADFALDPFTYIGSGTDWRNFGYARAGAGALDARARVDGDLMRLKAQALDPYATLRSVTVQHRTAEIRAVREDHRATPPAWTKP